MLQDLSNTVKENNADLGVTFSTNKSTIGLYARSNQGIAVKFNYLCTE